MWNGNHLNAPLHQVQNVGNNLNAKNELQGKTAKNKIHVLSQVFAKIEEQIPMPRELLKEHSGMSKPSKEMTS